LSGLIKKYWFIAGLVLVFTVTVADTTETVSGIGRWFKIHRGPDTIIVLIFFFSGLILNAREIRSGLMDIKGIAIALAIIFLVSPITGALFGMASLGTGIKIGVFLVPVMPTTLSSGVVMTGAAGGNMAHALVFTTSFIDRFALKLQVLNQWFVLGIVWMAMSQARDAIISTGGSVGIIFLLVFGFHGILLSCAGLFSKLLKLGRGRRESVIFMGSQKTLPLSVILQVSLFPQYGLALVVCVLHHMVHLLMDGYLVGS